MHTKIKIYLVLVYCIDIVRYTYTKFLNLFFLRAV